MTNTDESGVLLFSAAVDATKAARERIPKTHKVPQSILDMINKTILDAAHHGRTQTIIYDMNYAYNFDYVRNFSGGLAVAQLYALAGYKTGITLEGVIIGWD